MMKTIIIVILIAIFPNLSGQYRESNYLKAKSLMAIENYDSAIYFLEKAEEIQPGRTEVIYAMGLSQFELGNYDKAIEYFLTVNKRSSKIATLDLAKTEARLNHPELAVKYLREYLSLNNKLPEKDILLDEDFMRIENSQAWKNLWSEKDWYSEQDKELQEVIYLRNTGQELEAINRLRALDKKGFKRSDVNYQLATIYQENGNTKAALDALNRSIKSDARNIDALKLRIDLNMNENAFEEASLDCDRLLRLAPDQFDYYLVSGLAKSETGNFVQAINQVNSYLEYYPESHRAMNVLGLIHYKNGKYLDALSAFNNALERDDGEAAYFYNRGRTYAATKTYKFAEKDFSMALDLDPVNPDIWFEKGLTELELGKQDTACFDFKKALQYGKYEATDYINKVCQ